jgi:predicted acyltransferase (DUF342 family)
MKRLLQLASPILFLALAPALYAQKRADITQFGHDIRVQPNQQTSDLVCMGCSIYVRGQVAGDVVAILGRVVIDDNAEVSGDVVSLVGNVRVNSGAKIAGDLTALAGSVDRNPTAMIAGDVTSMSGTGWIFLILGVPLFFLAAIIAFIIWLVQRSRPSAAPVRA